MDSNNIKDNFWDKNINIKEYDCLNKNIESEIVIIGGGITGILCGYFLSEQGYDVTLVEKNRLYSGSTGHTTAHMSVIENYIYQDLTELYDKGVSRTYYKSHIDALKIYDYLISLYKIDCDYRVVDSNFYVIDDIDKLENEYKLLKEFGADVLFEKNTYIFNKKVQANLKMRNNRTFHPIKFLESLPKKFDIYEKTKVVDIDFTNNYIYTENNYIKYKYVICATNFPFLKLKGLYSLKMYKSSSFNVYYNNFNKKIDLYEDAVEDGITYRSYNNYLIMGGLDQRCGETKPRLDIFSFDLDNTFKNNNTKREKVESSCDSITFDGIPYIGRYLKDVDNAYLITGFNKYGMLNSMVSALEITNLIKNGKSIYNNIFNPHRKIKDKKYLKKHLFTTFKGFVFKKSDINRRCTHLYGKLSYNNINETYECSCHGSRFSKDGKVLEGPAIKDLNIKKDYSQN